MQARCGTCIVAQVIQFVVDQVKAKATNKSLVLIGTYTIGKERVFTAVARALGCVVYVDDDKYTATALLVHVCQTLLLSLPLAFSVILNPQRGRGGGWTVTRLFFTT